MECHPSDRPLDSELDVLFERGVKDEDTCCAVCGVPIIVAPRELREKNYRRYEWWTPCATHAEDYEYDSVPGGNVWIGRPGHDLPVEVYGADSLATLFNTVTSMGQEPSANPMRCYKIGYAHLKIVLYNIRLPFVSHWSHTFTTLDELAFVKRDGQLVFQKSLYASRFPLSGYFLMLIFNPQEYEVEPYPIQNLTSEILSYLQPLPEDRRSGFSEKSILMK
ncbi:hypothetical protein TESG_00981 [Trichophyton tonsurans CBS 112818]|uniref:Uncharacterized protein n=1 Tax=Trichophyton tonsurans (strain CBS 112818) TaxID=647933 RepID=F2RQ51_TRIT1|nr:hypothetical protein TESG_00981 [Trichophyton tonsurans CBS 112818]